MHLRIMRQKCARGGKGFRKSGLLLTDGGFQCGRLRFGKHGLRGPRFRAALFAVSEKRFKNFAQGAAAAKNARFYRADVALKHFGDFLVAQALRSRRITALRNASGTCCKAACTAC